MTDNPTISITAAKRQQVGGCSFCYTENPSYKVVYVLQGIGPTATTQVRACPKCLNSIQSFKR